MLLGLLSCIIRERFCDTNFIRTPEPEMLMADRLSVSAYDLEGKEGILLGVYYYQIIQMCGLLNKGDIVVDLGCGSCNLLCLLAGLNPSCQFIGIDLSAEMLALAKENIRAKNLSNITLLQQDVTNVSQIADHSIDVVISSMAIHHLPTEQLLSALFAEIKRLLKPQIRVYLYDFGKVKRMETIDFLLNSVTHPLVKDDYQNSLKAAFTLSAFKSLASQYLGQTIQIFSTLMVPVIVVIKTPSHALTKPQRQQLKRMVKQLNRQQKRDYKRLKLFLSLGGMRSLL